MKEFSGREIWGYIPLLIFTGRACGSKKLPGDTAGVSTGLSIGNWPSLWGRSLRQTSQKRGQEELPHVQGQGWRPRGATQCLRSGAAAERSYPTSEARGGGREELPHIQGQGQRLRVPGCDGTGAAERSYPRSEVRGVGREELPTAQGQEVGW